MNHRGKLLLICILAIILVIFFAFGYIAHRDNDQPKTLKGPLHPMVGCQKLQDGQEICA